MAYSAEPTHHSLGTSVGPSGLWADGASMSQGAASPLAHGVPSPAPLAAISGGPPNGAPVNPAQAGALFGLWADGTQSKGAEPAREKSIASHAEVRVSHPSDAGEQEAERVASMMSASDGEAPGAADSSTDEHTEDEQCLTEHADGEQRQPPASGAHDALPAISAQPHGIGCLCCSHLPGAAEAQGKPQGTELAAQVAQLRGGGQSLPANVQAQFERRFGQGFGSVRIHTDAHAAGLAGRLQARAFTIGNDIAFANGQYQPQTQEGQHLLAHELTHVVQQGGSSQQHGHGPSVDSKAGPSVQRSFFGNIWNGIKTAASTVWNGVKKAATATWEGMKWLGNKVWSGLSWLGNKVATLARDGAMWLINLIRDLPERLSRLAVTLWEGFKGAASFLPELIGQLAKHGITGLGSWMVNKLKGGAVWVGKLALNLMDLGGFPEIGEALLHLVSQTRKLRADEIAAAQQVLGSGAVRWGDVRVGSGELLNLIFKMNDSRAFTTWHTINAPEDVNVETMVHELTHVYQYEKVGSIYMAQAIHAQATLGSGAYDVKDLVAQWEAGKQLRDFNREKQAQIASSYYAEAIDKNSLSGKSLEAFQYYIGQLRAGLL